MAHVDLAAAGLTLWGLESYLAKRWGAASVWFALAVLAEETAVLVWWSVAQSLVASQAIVKPDSREQTAGTGTDPLSGSSRWKLVASLLTSVVVLCRWYAYHYSRTGCVFGNRSFFRYNVQGTMSGVRILRPCAVRQSFGYMIFGCSRF